MIHTFLMHTFIGILLDAFIHCSNACFSVVAAVNNQYEVDEEGDYVNVDPADTKSKLKGEAGAVGDEESAVYEKPESYPDHDYEEAAPDSKFHTVCFSLDENKEEEEETSDDEADYENVTAGISGEHEVVYENI